MTFFRPAVLALLLVRILHAGPANADFPAIPEPSRGALIYVPIYSSIFYKDSQRTIELSATLSIHNVDPVHPLTLTRIDYHDTNGKLVRHHLEQPLVLPALSTKNYVIDQADRTGGTGANFLVAWKSDVALTAPIVEALMISASSQSFAFTATGKIVRSADLGK